MKSDRDESSEESEAFLRPPVTGDEAVRPGRDGIFWKSVIWYLRIFFEIAIASSLVFLLFFRTSPAKENLGSSPVPQCM
jgi:hypothetical protein